jgi:transcriptional regulator with XRE-family HTH domain
MRGGRGRSRLANPVYAEEYQRMLARLREARRRAGLTQEQVAHALGEPQWFVSRCESGMRRVDAVELMHSARLYGSTVTRLLGLRE